MEISMDHHWGEFIFTVSFPIPIHVKFLAVDPEKSAAYYHRMFATRMTVFCNIIASCESIDHKTDRLAESPEESFTFLYFIYI